MRIFGLIGYPLSHSFSKKYFTGKFSQEGITDAVYEVFPLPDISALPGLLQNYPDLRGLNVTIPYKESVIAYIDKVHPSAARIGAVNVIKISKSGEKTGYNSDYFGFSQSLSGWFDTLHGEKGKARLRGLKALILGTGGASKAVKITLEDLNIAYISVSRQPADGQLSYEQLTEELLQNHHLIINTTPLGMLPQTDTFPRIPYQFTGANHYFYDLVYNPEETAFMKKGKEQGAQTINGLPMLYGQAEKSWQIWNE